jgi:hypothetical protein
MLKTQSTDQMTTSKNYEFFVERLKTLCQPDNHPRSIFRPTWFIGPSLVSVLHQSQSIGRVRLYLTFSMAIDRLYAPNLHTNTTKKHVAHTLTLGLVSNSNEAFSSPNNHSTQLDTYGSTMCSQVVYIYT